MDALYDVSENNFHGNVTYVILFLAKTLLL